MKAEERILEEKVIFDEATPREFCRYCAVVRKILELQLKAKKHAEKEKEQQKINALCAEADNLTQNLRLPF